MTERLDDSIPRLYRRSRELWLVGRKDEALEIYAGLRAAHGVELFPDIELPVHMKFIHPIACVLGRANYSDYLVCYQASGIGSDIDGNRPTIGRGVVLFPGARVLGNTVVGGNVWITANVVVQNMTIPSNCVVWPGVETKSGWRVAPCLVAKPTDRSVLAQFFPEAAV